MIELRTLGRLHADGPEPAADTLIRQPKLLALVCFTALESRRGAVPISRVCAMLWPDAELPRARRTLNNMLSSARRAGVDPIERVLPDGLVVASDRLRLDAATLLDGAPDAAWLLDHCHGEFLAGLIIPDAAELDRWLEETRGELRRRAVELLMEHAAAAALGDRIELLRRALLLDPYCEAAAVPMVHALAERGGRAEAWLFYDEFRSRLTDDLDLPVPAELTRAVIDVCGEDATSPEPPRLVRTHIKWHRARASRPVRAAVILAVMLGLTVAVQQWIRPDRAAAGAATLAHVAVGARVGSPVWRASVAPELAARLAERGMSLVVDAGDGDDAAFRLTGDVALEGDDVAGVVRLEDAATGALLDTWRLHATSSNLASSLASISDSVRIAVGRESTRRSLLAEVRPAAAIDALLRARAELDRGRAARSDGASAVEALHFAQADSLARVAATHDETWAQPQLLLAEVHEFRALRRLTAGDPAAAAALLERGIGAATRAVQLGAGAQALERRGGLHYLSWALGGAAAHSNYDAALADLLGAARDSAAGAQAWVTLASLHRLAGRLGDADVAARTALERDVFGRRAENILLQLFLVAFDAGRREDARRWCAELLRRSPGQWHAVECSLSLEYRRGPDAIARLDASDPSLAGNTSDAASRAGHFTQLTRAAAYASNGAHGRARALMDSVLAGGHWRETPYYEARVRAQLGELDAAASLLRTWIAEPGTPSRAGVVWERWFEPLHRRAGSARVFAESIAVSPPGSTIHR